MKRNINGILLLDKAKGVSSNYALQQIKRLFNASKAGHTGALDPLATGMLPICLGEATKFSQFLLDDDKTYQVTAKLGERTDTSDVEGQIIATRPVKIQLVDIQQVLPTFIGDIMQTPTMFSALKYQGQPLYKYARQGIEVPRKLRAIKVYNITILDYTAPDLTLEVHCSKGTYIRTLVDDLGELLGCGAHVTKLRRTNIASYTKQTMYRLSDLQTLNLSELDQLLLPMDTAITKLPSILLNQQQSTNILFGRSITLDVANNNLNPILARIYDEQNNFLGIANLKRQILSPKRLVNL